MKEENGHPVYPLKGVDINEIDNEYLKISLDKEQQTQNLNEALSIGRGTEAVFPLFYYDTKTKKYNLEVIDSRTEIDGKKVRDNSKRRKFEKVDKELKELGFKGMEKVLQAVLLTDLYSLLPSKKFGICLREKILTDEFIRQKLVDNDKLFKSGKVDMKEYLRACEEFNFEDALPYIKSQLKEYIDYIDLDRLFLISLYRLEAGLDTKIISANSQAGIELLMEVIYKNIPRDLSFSYLLENAVQRNGELRKIEYSASDAQKCLKRFALNGKYLSKEEVKEYREGFFKGELSLYDIESDFIPSIFNSEELEKLIENEKHEEKPSDEVINASGKRVLVVDDNQLNLKVAERLLKAYKCDIDFASSGSECITKIANGEKYDLILLDDMMPKMSGSETLVKLKEIDNFDTPVCVLTANAITGMREEYLGKGFNDYLSKPIVKEELNRVIKKYLKK